MSLTPTDSSATQNTLDYAPRETPARMSDGTCETVRRIAQRSAALAAVFFVGGIIAAKTIGKVDGDYGDELFILLLFVLSLISLAVWFVAFCLWLVAVVQTRRGARETAKPVDPQPSR